MKRFATYIVVACTISTPLLAFAEDTQASLSTQVSQLLTTAAQLQAQIASITTGEPLACAIFASKATVRASEPFVLAWGSVGAMNPGDDPKQSMRPQNGASLIVIQDVGTRKYTFTFYGKGGTTTTCTTKVTVTAM